MVKPAVFRFFLFALLAGYSIGANATHLRAGDITASRPDCQTLTVAITLHVYTRVDPSVTVVFGGGTLDFGDGTTLITLPRPKPPVIAQVDNGGVVDVEYPVTHTYAA